jgi:hypothetical protein
MAFLYGRTGRLTAKNGGFWPGQSWDQVGPRHTDDGEDRPVWIWFGVGDYEVPLSGDEKWVSLHKAVAPRTKTCECTTVEKPLVVRRGSESGMGRPWAGLSAPTQGVSCVDAADEDKALPWAVDFPGGRRGSAGRGVVKGVLDPPEHLLTSFHAILRKQCGGHLPTSPSF